MKIIFPSFALFAATAAIAFAQTDPRAPAMQTGAPPAATSPAENGGGAAGMVPATPNAMQSGTLVSGANAPASDAATKPADGAEIFMQRVDTATDQLKSVQARIRYRTNLFGVQNVGTGFYLQQGSGEQRQFRLELKTAIG